MSFIAITFHPAKAHLKAEMFYYTRVDMAHEHFFYAGDSFMNNKILPLPENKLHDLLERVVGE